MSELEELVILSGLSEKEITNLAISNFFNVVMSKLHKDKCKSVTKEFMSHVYTKQKKNE